MPAVLAAIGGGDGVEGSGYAVRWPLRAASDPVTTAPAFMVVRGNLAPVGAVLKAAAASPELLRHTGPAVVFHSYAEMRRRMDDPSLDVTRDFRRDVQHHGAVAGPAHGAVGGPLSRIRDGDLITLDAFAGELSVEPGVLDGREPILPAVEDRRGWPALHRMHVTQAPEGCDYDFLQARGPEQLAFVEPVIGRS